MRHEAGRRIKPGQQHQPATDDQKANLTAGLRLEGSSLDRVAFGAEDGVATVSAGKYIAEDVYIQVGAGGAGGVGAEVEWEPTDEVSIISSADGSGDTKIAVRWKKDY